MRCDNAGENKTAEKLANGAQWKLSVQFEYTARDTPQQNSLVETGFAHVLNKARALLIDANVPYLLRYKIIQEAVLTATKLDGLVTTYVDNKSQTRYELFGMKNPSFVNHLRTWGEAGVVKISSKTSPKLKNKGVTCAFVGHADNHAADCYRMWDPVGHYVYVTRDMIWLKRMYFPKTEEDAINTCKAIEVPVSAAGESDNEVTAENQNNNETPDLNTEVPEPATNAPPTAPTELPFKEVKFSSKGRTMHPRKFYQDEYQGVCADANYFSVLSDNDEESDDDGFYEISNVGAGIGGGFTHSSELKTLNYKQAMASKDTCKWKKEIKKEHERMLKYKVWEPVPKKDVPNAQPLTSTWAFKKKI